MAVNKREGLIEKARDFFTQKPADHRYEREGGDARVPVHERTADPKADANRIAEKLGEEVPYPGHGEGDVFTDGEGPGNATR